MLHSMTAFGRTVESTPMGTLGIEVQSVNRKHLDVRIHCAPEFRRFEVDIQNWIAESVGRGQINVKIDMSYEKEAPVKVKPNLELARQVKEAGEEIASELGIDDPQFAVRLVGSNKDLLNFSEEMEDEEKWKGEIKRVLDLALKPFLDMKKFEGKKLLKDFHERLGKIEEGIQAIAELSGRSTDAMREKLTKIIESAFPEKPDNEDAVLREICLYAEKVDIEEEITRFKAHIDHFRETLEEGGAVGKTLDFIAQELFREVNTIASKAADIEVSRKTVEIKTELERIREQLQNVE